MTTHTNEELILAAHVRTLASGMRENALFEATRAGIEDFSIDSDNRAEFERQWYADNPELSFVQQAMDRLEDVASAIRQHQSRG